MKQDLTTAQKRRLNKELQEEVRLNGYLSIKAMNKFIEEKKPYKFIKIKK